MLWHEWSESKLQLAHEMVSNTLYVLYFNDSNFEFQNSSFSVYIYLSRLYKIL